MPQSSLTTWLQKPAAVKESSKPSTRPDKGQLPTPLPSSQDIPAEEERDAPTNSSPTEAFTPTTASTTLSKVLNLPPNVELRPCRNEDITPLKRLNQLLLPIPYPESFYREILADKLTNAITLLAVWHDAPSAVGMEKGRLVGAIRCRLFAHPPTPSKPKPTTGAAEEKPMLYLSTLVLLSPYRGHGIATALLQTLLRRAVETHGIGSVGAHVWEANAEGLEWYAKRGFVEVGRERGYYGKLRPSGAVVVKRDVGVLDLVGGG